MVRMESRDWDSDISDSYIQPSSWLSTCARSKHSHRYYMQCDVFGQKGISRSNGMAWEHILNSQGNATVELAFHFKVLEWDPKTISRRTQNRPILGITPAPKISLPAIGGLLWQMRLQHRSGFAGDGHKEVGNLEFSMSSY